MGRHGRESGIRLTDVNGGLGDVNGRMDEMKKLQEESLGQKFQSALRETQAALEPLGKQLADLAQMFFRKLQKESLILLNGFLSYLGQLKILWPFLQA